MTEKEWYTPSEKTPEKGNDLKSEIQAIRSRLEKLKNKSISLDTWSEIITVKHFKDWILMSKETKKWFVPIEKYPWFYMYTSNGETMWINFSHAPTEQEIDSTKKSNKKKIKLAPRDTIIILQFIDYIFAEIEKRNREKETANLTV